MIIRHEEVRYQDPFLCLKIWENTRTIPDTTKIYKKWHYHKEVEFVLVLEGQLTAHVPEASWTVGKGDVILFGSNQVHHSVKLSPELRTIVFQFDVKAHDDTACAVHFKRFQDILCPLSSLNYIFRNNAEANKEAATAITTIFDEINHRKKGYAIAVSLLIRTLFLTLVRYDYLDLLQYEKVDLVDDFEQVLKYVDDHLSDKVTVSDASRMMHMSYPHFLRTFKKAFGMPFIKYVNLKRIKRAEQLLLTESWSIDQIAQAIGIPNRAHFNEIFKRFHSCTPTEYKKKMNIDSQSDRRLHID